jgi:hypothetical protein
MIRVLIHHVVDSFSPSDSAVGVEQGWLMEGLGLVESSSVLGPDDIGVQVLLSLPGSLVEQLGIGLEATGLGAPPIALVHGVVELDVPERSPLESIRLGSIFRVEESFPHSGAPFLVETGVGLESGLFAVAPEEVGSGGVEVLLIFHEATQ